MSLVFAMELLEQELACLSDAAARGMGDTALVEKRKTLALLEELERTEARCAMQLTMLEATLDTTCLTLRQLQPGGPAPPSVETVRCALQAEVAAIVETQIAGPEAQWL